MRKHFDPANISDSILSGSITILKLALLDSPGKPLLRHNRPEITRRLRGMLAELLSVWLVS